MAQELKQKLVDFIAAHHKSQDEVPKVADDISDILNFEITTASHDVRVADFDTPLISALIRTNNFDLASLVCAQDDLDLTATDSNGSTALDYALEKRNAELSKMLAEKGCNATHLTYRDASESGDDPASVWRQSGEINIKDIILGNQDITLLEDANSDAADSLRDLIGLDGD
mgnify:FL=1